MTSVSRGPAANDLRERIETSYDTATGKQSVERLLAFEDRAWVEKKQASFAYDEEGRLRTVTHARLRALVAASADLDRLAALLRRGGARVRGTPRLCSC